MAEFIPVNIPLLDGNEKKYLAECIDSGWISSEGPFVRRFEQEFAASVGRAECIAVSNGSAALEVAMAALEIGTGDEVILPAFTIISCASAIVRAGAVPVPVDCREDTWNMDADAIEKMIGPRTRAIMMVHIYGLPVDIDPVLDIARRHNLYVIEDAAEAIGLEYKGAPCGSFGDISTFSFYANKLVTTGEGGMLATNDKELAGRCKLLRNLCFQEQQRFRHEALGWNFRMTNMQAAIGLAQLENMQRHISLKREIGHRYREKLGALTALQLPLEKTAYADNIYWVYGLVLQPGVSINAETAMACLLDKGIGTRQFFWPIHEQPVLKKMGLFRNTTLPRAEYLARNGFYVPSGLGLSMEQVDYVSDTLRELFH